MRNRTAVVVPIGLAQILAWASSVYLPGVLAEPIARDIGLSPPWIYAAFSLGLGISALLAPRLGHYIDGNGGRLVLCGSNVGFAAGLIVLACSHGAILLGLAWLMLGVAMSAGLYEAAFAALTLRYGHDSRNAITGITLIGGLSSAVAWPATTLLERLGGWREACLTWAVLHLIVGLPLNAWALESSRGEVTRPVVVPERAVRGLAWTSDAGMWALAILYSATGIVSFGIGTNLPRLFTSLGANTKSAIVIASLVGPVQVATRFLEFTARRKITPLTRARMATLMHPIGALLVTIAGTPAIVGFSILHGAGSGMLTIARGTLPLAFYGPEGYGARIGQLSAPARIGQAAAPFVFGLAIDRFGGAALLISSGLFVLAFVALTRVSLPSGS
jgi:MFS family permease